MARRRKPSAQQAVQSFLRLQPRQQLITVGIVLAIVLVAAVGYYAASRKPPAAPPVVVQAPPATKPPVASRPATVPYGPGSSSQPRTAADHLLLGNPSNAKADPASKDNFLMAKPYFALSYNNSKGCPNWVSWRVAVDDLGDAPRKRTFDPDSDLPRGFTRIEHRDYTNSGFDRGHMCPHGDRDATQESSYATFVMTNIIPQAPKVNQGNWAELETYCRSLTAQGNRLYITAGPIGAGGTGTNGSATTVAGGKVTVPAQCWKVVVVVHRTGGDNDLAKINASTRVIAVVIPNDQAAGGKRWQEYMTSVAEVERQTGYHFFDRMAPDVAAALKKKVDGASK